MLPYNDNKQILKEEKKPHCMSLIVILESVGVDGDRIGDCPFIWNLMQPLKYIVI